MVSLSVWSFGFWLSCYSFFCTTIRSSQKHKDQSAPLLFLFLLKNVNNILQNWAPLWKKQFMLKRHFKMGQYFKKIVKSSEIVQVEWKMSYLSFISNQGFNQISNLTGTCIIFSDVDNIVLLSLCCWCMYLYLLAILDPSYFACNFLVSLPSSSRDKWDNQ